MSTQDSDSRNRLQSLDFLRGIAIILVLFAHHWIGIDNLQAIGWVGVDLFFVLSGFLVSGLLFGEYKKYGNIRKGLFLIRRGFKIYPLFYVLLVVTMVIAVTHGFHDYDKLNTNGKIITTVSEILFLQNYFGSYWNHHWSLAVEEHFYLLVVLTFTFFIHRVRLVLLVFPICLILRIFTQVYWLETGFAETHLRIDSLAMGVCIAYVYNFGDLKGLYQRYRMLILPLLFIPLIFLFTGNPLHNPFTKTIGFTLLYVSFGAYLLVFLFERTSWLPGYRLVAKIGVYSYGIYLVHMYFIRFGVGDPGREFTAWVVMSFALYFLGSIFAGTLLSMAIEKPFLRIRDKYFPKRVETPYLKEQEPLN